MTDEVKVERQISSMVAFLMKEAEEHVEAINFKTDEEFNLQKQRAVQSQKVKIIEEFDKKEKAILVKRKIQESNEINRLRLSVLKEREEALRAIYEEARNRLADISGGASYPDQLRLLILQGCMKMKEGDVLLQCREADRDLVEASIPVPHHLHRSRPPTSAGTVTTHHHPSAVPPPHHQDRSTIHPWCRHYNNDTYNDHDKHCPLCSAVPVKVLPTNNELRAHYKHHSSMGGCV
jgi:V-type H+-transporting ATPase subunit E